MKMLIEIRPGEGGADAKLLVQDQAAIYQSARKAPSLRWGMNSAASGEA